MIVLFLTGDAERWWKGIEPSVPKPTTWNHFRGAFLRHYYPDTTRLNRISEFDNLKQTGNMSVTEYSQKLHALGRFVPSTMGDEELQMLRFKGGLLSRIQTGLVMNNARNFPELLEAALKVETDIKRRDGLGDNPKKNFKGKGQMEAKKDGDQKPKTNARVFAMTEEDLKDNNEVVTGTLLVNSVPAFVLIDCGASHSFVSKKLSKSFKKSPQTTIEPYRVRVSTPGNRVLVSDLVYPKCPVEIEGVNLWKPT